MHEPHPDWSPLGVNFKILNEHPNLFYIFVPPPPSHPPTQFQSRQLIMLTKLTGFEKAAGIHVQDFKQVYLL